MNNKGQIYAAYASKVFEETGQDINKFVERFAQHYQDNTLDIAIKGYIEVEEQRSRQQIAEAENRKLAQIEAEQIKQSVLQEVKAELDVKDKGVEVVKK